MGECKTCRWAKWDLNKRGGINWQRDGVCQYEVPIPTLPACVINYGVCKIAIWVGDGKECPVWEAKE